ncbi:hypothetical protein V6C42_00715 [Pseudoclostridium thermosuccinogenes]|uniref:hypothetical protein n=1 Tax=Clostridium thermosuccinogenes TaxID=84032 RepID=UPI002FD949A6
MSSFALVTFKDEHREKDDRAVFFKYIAARLKDFFKRPVLEDNISKIELYEGLDVYIIRLPYCLSEIDRHKARLNRFLSGFAADNDIKYCFLPKDTPDGVQLDACMKFASTGKLLYKSALTLILDEIYTKRNIVVSELDICIVEGESRTELYGVIDLLAPFVKYITIVAKDREAVEEEMNRVYDDTGLCVRVTEEYRSCLKNADIIINLGGLENIPVNAKVNPRAIILNYGSSELNKHSCENIILNGFIINIKKNIPHIITEDVLKAYDATGLMEVILFFRAGMEDKLINEYIDGETAKGVSEAFLKCGCSIKEFYGRRNKIKPKDIAI